MCIQLTLQTLQRTSDVLNIKVILNRSSKSAIRIIKLFEKYNYEELGHVEPVYSTITITANALKGLYRARKKFATGLIA